MLLSLLLLLLLLLLMSSSLSSPKPPRKTSTPSAEVLGETLAVIEARKMQNVRRAEQDGTVKKIHATAGATLAVDALILEFA